MVFEMFDSDEFQAVVEQRLIEAYGIGTIHETGIEQVGEAAFVLEDPIELGKIGIVCGRLYE